MSVASGKKKQHIWKRDAGRCYYCGYELSWEEKTVDHVIPKSKGGSNRTWNLVIACKPCNQFKADSDPKQSLLDLVMMRMRSHQMYIMLLRSRHAIVED